MHCVVNELGKGMLHTANTMGILWCSQSGQYGTGNSGEVGGISDWARSAPHCVLSLRVGRVAWGGMVGTRHHVPAPPEHLSWAVTETSVLWSAVLTEQGCALQTLQVLKALMSGTKLLVIHTASCRLT